MMLTKPRYPDVASVRGAAGKLAKPVTWQKMRETARDEYAQGKMKQKKR